MDGYRRCLATFVFATCAVGTPSATVFGSKITLAAFDAAFSTQAATLFANDASFQARVDTVTAAAAAVPDTSQYVIVLLRPQYFVSSALAALLESDTGAEFVSPVGARALVFSSNYTALLSLSLQAEVEHAMIFLPELKVTPHFEMLLNYAQNATATSLSDSTVALSAHFARPLLSAHGRRASAVDVVARVQAAHSQKCAAHGNAPTRPPSCGPSGVLDTFTVSAASNATLVARGVPFSAALALATEIADDPEVLWVEPIVPIRAFNRVGSQLVTAGSQDGADGLIVPKPGPNPMWQMGLHGEDEIIAVGDTGLDLGHCFFKNARGETSAEQTPSSHHRKVVSVRSFSGDLQPSSGGADHGTHVVGTILGQSIDPSAASADFSGLASAAKVAFVDLENAATGEFSAPDDLLVDYFEPEYAAGARVFSNSWGIPLNYYLWSSSDVDAFMYLYPDALVLFAAGNYGADGPATVGAPATCKSCLAVGASESHGHGNRDGNVASFSSQGPALRPTENASSFDPAAPHRIKPEVVAPGEWLWSAASDSACGVAPMAGTSMATPLVAAAVALARQYFREGRYPTGAAQREDTHNASGALLKALVVHSAVPLHGTYQGKQLQSTPSNIQGFGRVQLDRILFAHESTTPPSSRIIFDDNATHALSFFGDEYCLNVSSFGADTLLGSTLKITLTWSDPPAWPFAIDVLVNDLDLKLRSGESDALLSVDDLVLHTDAVGTVEQATLRVPESGVRLRACVYGAAIRYRTQPFALVVTGPNLGVPFTSVAAPLPPFAAPSAESPGPIWIVVGVAAAALGVAIGTIIYGCRQRHRGMPKSIRSRAVVEAC